MKCPHCNKDIKESLIVEQAAKIAGKRKKKAMANVLQKNGVKKGIHSNP